MKRAAKLPLLSHWKCLLFSPSPALPCLPHPESQQAEGMVQELKVPIAHPLILLVFIPHSLAEPQSHLPSQ